MTFHNTSIKDLYIIDVNPHEDDRGYFTRIFCKNELHDFGITFDVVQINKSLTKKKGTLRGMHFQKTPKAEDKIVQCIKGSVYDVALDVRPDSQTYGKWVAQELSEDNKKMLFIPKGFAHGFQTLSDNCEMLYFMSEYYSPVYASGVKWDDPKYNITWPLKNPILDEKDKTWGTI